MGEKRQQEILGFICDGFSSVLRTVSPYPTDDAQILRTIMESNKMDDYLVGKIEPSGLLLEIILCHNEASSYQLRVLALSHVVGKLGFLYLCQFNNGPGVNWNPKLNKRIFLAAKHLNIENGHGLTKPLETHHFRQKFDPKMIEALYDFLNSTSLVNNTAYGTVSRKTTDGRRLTMCKIVRIYEHPKLISLASSYLSELGYQPPGRSSFYELLDYMPASGPVAMKGVNPFYVSMPY